MGKTKDKKKKGKGMEKTLAKTEKKLDKNLKKELQEIGEDDIEALIEKHTRQEKELSKVVEETLPSGKVPSRRGGATLSLLPEKDELVLFGGDFFDGNKVYMYNDLFLYSIKKNHWSKIKAPGAPPPRTFHQACVVSRNGGELWIFGGEYSSPSQSQFYHYNDLWVFSFQSKQWTKIIAPNGPSARSGHRMIVYKKYLMVFGGYYDNLRNCRFYNDTYLFNLETNQWEEMSFSAANDLPSPRSACQLSLCAKNGSVVMFGGFSKEKLKKERERPIVHSDMYVLTCQLKRNEKLEWAWKRVKQGGLRPSERISFSMITLNDETALLFGGVFDQDEIDDDEEETVSSNFFNDLYKLDLTSYKWTHLNLKGKSEKKSKKQAKTSTTDLNKSNMEVDNSEDEEVDEDEEETKPESLDMESLKLKPESAEDSGTFTISYSSPTTSKLAAESSEVDVISSSTPVFMPHPRRSSYLQFHKGVLYLYGGKFENEEEKEFTFNDMYALNVKKLDEWKTIYQDKDMEVEIAKSKSNNGADMESESDEESDDDGDDEDDDESEMEIDAPAAEPNESLEDYFKRTNDIWQQEAISEFPGEKSKKILDKMAFELCKMFWHQANESK